MPRRASIGVDEQVVAWVEVHRLDDALVALDALARDRGTRCTSRRAARASCLWSFAKPGPCASPRPSDGTSAPCVERGLDEPAELRQVAVARSGAPPCRRCGTSGSRPSSAAARVVARSTCAHRRGSSRTACSCAGVVELERRRVEEHALDRRVRRPARVAARARGDRRRGLRRAARDRSRGTRGTPPRSGSGCRPPSATSSPSGGTRRTCVPRARCFACEKISGSRCSGYTTGDQSAIAPAGERQRRTAIAARVTTIEAMRRALHGSGANARSRTPITRSLEVVDGVVVGLGDRVERDAVGELPASSSRPPSSVT